MRVWALLGTSESYGGNFAPGMVFGVLASHNRRRAIPLPYAEINPADQK